MTIRARFEKHRRQTQKLARALSARDVYDWLVDCGYYPESYVLPPCFVVVKRPKGWTKHYNVPKKKGGKYGIPRTECASVHFPKTTLTDRSFGVMHPRIHNDIAYHITRNWKALVSAMIPAGSEVVSYSFPVPINSRHSGRIGALRSGRLIYEFLTMVDDDIAASAYRYSHLVRADIKNFYPSIYTHSIAWALHGKRKVRKKENIYDYRLLGNRLDKLFQNANDGCTNGIPIGPAASDIIAEVVASAVDVALSQSLSKADIDCEMTRFKDDYRILTKSEGDAKSVIKHLQAALKQYNLELSDDKTSVAVLPGGLFRPWASMYHVAHPRRKRHFSWKEFRELYLAVLEIEKACPGTGVIDRFLADIVSKRHRLRVNVGASNLQKVISMLLMLASLRLKAFPKVMAIIEAVLRTPFGVAHQPEILEYLESYLGDLAKDEDRNKYLITWICYFLVSNGLKKQLKAVPVLRDPITRAVLNNRSTLFSECKDYKLFKGSRARARDVSMLEYLDVFNPPEVG